MPCLATSCRPSLMLSLQQAFSFSFSSSLASRVVSLARMLPVMCTLSVHMRLAVVFTHQQEYGQRQRAGVRLSRSHRMRPEQPVRREGIASSPRQARSLVRERVAAPVPARLAPTCKSSASRCLRGPRQGISAAQPPHTPGGCRDSHQQRDSRGGGNLRLR